MFLFPIPIRALEPPAERPKVTHALIGTCAGVWAFIFVVRWLEGDHVLPTGTFDRVLLFLGFVPDSRLPWTYLTSSVTHVGLFHLLFNLLPFWMFGIFLEVRMGAKRYSWFLAVVAVVGSESHAQFLSHLGMTDMLDRPCIGASDLVYGIYGAFLVLLPRLKFVFFYMILLHWNTAIMSAALYIPVWVLLTELVSFYFDSPGSGVSHAAHVGGFAAGVVFGLGVRFLPKRQATIRKERMEERISEGGETDLAFRNFKRALSLRAYEEAFAVFETGRRFDKPIPVSREQLLDLATRLEEEDHREPAAEIYRALLEDKADDEVRFEAGLRLCEILLTFEKKYEVCMESLRKLGRRYRDHPRFGELEQLAARVKEAERKFPQRRR